MSKPPVQMEPWYQPGKSVYCLVASSYIVPRDREAVLAWSCFGAQKQADWNQTMATSTKRVLIYRLGSLGDTLIALPALHLIASAFPGAERRMLTNFPVNVKAPPAAAILENTDLVHGYFRYVVGTRSPREVLALWWQLLRWRPDVLVYLGSKRGVESARRDAKFFRLCGISRLIGIPGTVDKQENRWLGDELALEPEGARLARNIKELGDARLDEPGSWDLHLTQAQLALASGLYGLSAET
jgi:heptosyltransferase-3